jgi:hypothetical protein
VRFTAKLTVPPGYEDDVIKVKHPTPTRRTRDRTHTGLPFRLYIETT